MTEDPNELTIDAFLADSVVVADNKLYVQGAGWDTIFAASFPARHPRLGIGVLLRVPWTMTNQVHDFGIRIVDPDDNRLSLGNAAGGTPGSIEGQISEIRGQFNVGRPPVLSPGDSQLVPIAMNLDGIEFAAPNAYSVVVSIDGHDVRRVPLRIRTLPQMPTPGPGPGQIPFLGR
jgi:hypothetical protein